MKKISEKKTKSKNNLIVLVGLFLSLIGAIVFIYTGIDELINATEEELYYYSMYFYIIIFFGVLALIGVIIGFFYEKVGIGMSLFVGFISFVNALVSGLSLIGWLREILVFLILIGGIISLIGWLRERKLQKNK